MSDFIFLYRTTEAEQVANMGTPETAQQSMQAWLGWIRELEAKGHLKNPGQPLDRTGKVVRPARSASSPTAPSPRPRTSSSASSSSRRGTSTRRSSCRRGCPMLERQDGSVEIRPVTRLM